MSIDEPTDAITASAIKTSKRGPSGSKTIWRTTPDPTNHGTEPQRVDESATGRVDAPLDDDTA